MKCKICGSEIRPGDTVCHVCGVIVDYHDYVNDPFSSAEDRINELNNNKNSINNSDNFFPTQNNEQSTFFGDGSNDNKSSGSSEKVKYAIAAVIALILLIGCSVLLVKVLSPEPKTVNSGNEVILGGDDEEEVEEPSDPEEPNIPEKPVTPSQNDTYKKFEGYKFKVLDGYTVSEEEESLIFENRTEKVEFVLSIYHVNPYEKYIERMDEVKQQWEDRGYVISDYGERQIGSVNWLILTSTYNEKPFTIVYRAFFNNSTVEMLILNYGNLTNEEIYSKLEEMLIVSEIDDGVQGTST